MSNTKLRPLTYLVAALSFAIMQARAEIAAGLKRSTEIKQFFNDTYRVELPDEALEQTLVLMERVGLLKIDDNEYVGRYYTIQKTALERRFREMASQLDDSPFAIILRGKLPWISDILGSQKFWEDIRSDLAAPASQTDLPSGEVPASDRTVTLLHNSPERIEISNGLSNLHHELTTSNSIAEEFGEDRERVVAEVEASQAGLRSERIKIGFLKDVVLKVLREAGKKLKDKALELGIDRLIALVEALIGHVN